MISQTLVVFWCAGECARQKSGELSVADMYKAWTLPYEENLYHASVLPYQGFILDLGKLVEPEKNKNGFRKTPVIVNGTLIGHENIVRGIGNLCFYAKELSPEEFYLEFEKIHPFVDGNGRVGAILYNIMSHSIESPITPPNVF